MGGGRNGRAGQRPRAAGQSAISDQPGCREDRDLLVGLLLIPGVRGNTATDRSHQAARSMGEECATEPAIWDRYCGLVVATIGWWVAGRGGWPSRSCTARGRSARVELGWARCHLHVAGRRFVTSRRLVVDCGGPHGPTRVGVADAGLLDRLDTRSRAVLGKQIMPELHQRAVVARSLRSSGREPTPRRRWPYRFDG